MPKSSAPVIEAGEGLIGTHFILSFRNETSCEFQQLFFKTLPDKLPEQAHIKA